MDLKDFTQLLEAFVNQFVLDASKGIALLGGREPGKARDLEEREAWLRAASYLQAGAAGEHLDRMVSILALQLGKEPREIYQGMLTQAEKLAEQYPLLVSSPASCNLGRQQAA